MPARAARARHLDAEHRGLLDLRVGRHRGLDLGGRDVLALPPEGVAEPVGERRVPEALRAHQVAGVEPDVAFLEGVAHELLLAGFLVGVAVERLEVADLRQQQTRLAGLHLADPAVVAAHRVAGLLVVLDERAPASGRCRWSCRTLSTLTNAVLPSLARVELAHPRRCRTAR